MGNSAKRDAAAAETAERYRKALELRKAGATYDQIAAQLGYSAKAAARHAVQAAIKEIIREPAEEVIQLELSRLDAMLLGCWTKAKSGDVHCIDRALRIMERRASYLGIDAPKRSSTEMAGELKVTDGAHEQLLARIARLAAAAGTGEGDPGADGD